MITIDYRLKNDITYVIQVGSTNKGKCTMIKNYFLLYDHILFDMITNSGIIEPVASYAGKSSVLTNLN